MRPKSFVFLKLCYVNISKFIGIKGKSLGSHRSYGNQIFTVEKVNYLGHIISEYPTSLVIF